LKITARVTAVFPSAEPRRAILSTLPHIASLDTAKTQSGQFPLEALPIGFIVESAKVIQVIEKQGVYVDVGVEGVKGFVHVYPFLIQSLTIRFLVFLMKELNRYFQILDPSNSHPFIEQEL